MKEETMLNAKEYDIKSAAISDHEQIIIKMRWGNRPVWGRGCWKLHNELLKQDKFKDEVQQIIQVYRADKGYFDPNTGWDVLKLNIKKMGYTICNRFGKTRKKPAEGPTQ